MTLNPGEEKEVRFLLSPSQTAFLDEDMRWLIEKGEFQVQIGASSEDIRLTDSYTVIKSAYVKGKDRRFYARANVISADGKPADREI